MTASHKIPIALTVLLFFAAFSWLWFLKENTGVSWDEPWGQALAKKSYDYVTGKNNDLLNRQYKYHGAAFELFTEAVAQSTGAYSFAGRLQVRRTMLLSVFLLGALFLFFAARRLTENNWFALFSMVILFFTPRIMAHASVNSKDIPMLAAACFFLWASVRFWKTSTSLNALLCGMSGAFMVVLRIPALYIIPLWIFLWVFTFDRRQISVSKCIRNVFIFLISFITFTYLCWPVLWNNPIKNFADAWVFMSQYPWENEVLFNGEFISSLHLPASYIPTWMVITIPPVWTLFFIFAVLVMVPLFIKRKKESAFFIFLFGFVITPIAAVIFLKSVIYDEWRHLFFIYPAFILLCIYGIYQASLYLKSSVMLVIPVILLSVVQISEVVFWSANHPVYSYLYFNPFIRNSTCGNFEQDYWGFSYKQANDFLLTQYEGTPLKIHYGHLPGVYNYWALPDADMAKLERTPYDQADYFITTHRFEKETYNFGKTVYEERVNGCAIITVYQKQ